MIYLVIYDRTTAATIAIKAYVASQRENAQNDRLAEELAALHSGVDREVVIVEADDVEQLRRTHARYFENVEQIANRSRRPGGT